MNFGNGLTVTEIKRLSVSLQTAQPQKYSATFLEAAEISIFS
jgi:hypothetical protein